MDREIDLLCPLLPVTPLEPSACCKGLSRRLRGKRPIEIERINDYDERNRHEAKEDFNRHPRRDRLRLPPQINPQKPSTVLPAHNDGFDIGEEALVTGTQPAYTLW